MQRRGASSLTGIALSLALAAACGSEDSPGPSDPATTTNPTNPPESSGGVCSTEDKAACDECVAKASDVCSASVCRQEDLDLENCSVMAVYYPCEDELGNPSIDCCKLQGDALIRCWNRCPEMLACM